MSYTLIPARVCILILGFFAAPPQPEGAGGFPLHEAVQNRNTRAVLSLIERGVDVNAARPDGSTPLAWAVNRDDREIVVILIQAGARVNAADENGENPLTLACAQGNLEIARILLDAGADPSLKR